MQFKKKIDCKDNFVSFDKYFKVVLGERNLNKRDNNENNASDER